MSHERSRPFNRKTGKCLLGSKERRQAEKGWKIGRRQPGVLVDFMLQHLPPDPGRGETVGARNNGNV